MIASICIAIICSALFVYWFRYTCWMLIGQGSAEYALKVASTVRLNFPDVQAALRRPQTDALDRLHSSLEDDYRILTGLLRDSTTDQTIEQRILSIDYKVMQVWYRVTRIGPTFFGAKCALREMSSILTYFASEIGQAAVS